MASKSLELEPNPGGTQWAETASHTRSRRVEADIYRSSIRLVRRGTAQDVSRPHGIAVGARNRCEGAGVRV